MGKAVLLTGFEPFGDYVINSSWQASRLVGQRMAADVRARRLPVDHMRARAKLLRYLAQQKPVICLCTGLTPAPTFGIERVARKPAQFGELEGAEVLEGAWPWDEVEALLRAAGCEACLSDDAGQYVCESTYWSLLAFRQAFGYPAYAGFIHVPPLSTDMTAETIAAALENVIRARLEGAGAKRHERVRKTRKASRPAVQGG